MDIHFDSFQRRNSSYHDVDGQLQQRQISKRLSEASHATPQKNFTQVTVAAYQRKNSCHGDLGIIHYKPDKDRQRGDLMRRPICNEKSWGNQYKSFRALSYYNQTDSMDAIDQQQQCPPSMLCTTSSYLSRPHQTEPCWTGFPFSTQNHPPDDDRALFSPKDCFSPYVAVGLPLTPADTIQAEDLPPKSSLNNREPPITSPVYKIEAASCGVVPGTNTISPRPAAIAVEEPEDSKSLLTPPPESMCPSAERTFPLFDAKPQAADAQIGYYASPDTETKGRGTNHVDPSNAPVVGEESDLNFSSSNWDPNSFDFLNDENGWAPAFMSDQETDWDTKHTVLPSAYPALAPDSGYTTGIEVGSASFQAHSLFATERPLEYQFDQYGACLPAPSNLNDLETFHSPCPTFDTHPFSIQLNSTSQANDRTSHRTKNKDQMLVELKQRGYSYKDIKIMGQFEEAESTLRGRYRTLTKPKEARVRKPEWGDREVSSSLDHENRLY